MKVRIYSDLHLEFGRRQDDFTQRAGEDLVILAGDIDVGTDGVYWAVHTFPEVPVVYVLGNHEYYDQHWETLVGQCKAAAEGTNVHVLERDAVDVAGVRVLGCTLWTDYKLFGESRFREAVDWAWDSLNDFRVIRGDKMAPFTPNVAAAACAESAEWLNKQIDLSDRPTIVVTHHSPTARTIDPFYAGKIGNSSFHSNLEHLIRPPVRMWIHGHTHFNADVQINRVRVVTNQWGYPNEAMSPFRGNGLFELELGGQR